MISFGEPTPFLGHSVSPHPIKAFVSTLIQTTLPITNKDFPSALEKTSQLFIPRFEIYIYTSGPWKETQ